MNPWKSIVWQQFGASIDMLENAVRACPDEVWEDAPPRQQFWYLAYHGLYFLDYYLSESDVDFAPPAPFTNSEAEPGVLPARTYTKDELLGYLAHGRKKCRARIDALTEETAHRPCGFSGRDLTAAELLLYNMRHVQHHTAQLNLILRQKTDSAPRWVSKADDELRK